MHERLWKGPVIGMRVSQVWQGYAATLFVSFGRLTPAGYVLLNGEPGTPKGEFELTTMEGLCGWDLFTESRLLVTADHAWQRRERLLTKLVGRRLNALSISARSRATILSFSGGLFLRTRSMTSFRERPPHWLLRIDENQYPTVELKRSSWRSGANARRAGELR